tara:strand:- start:111429 stop:112790 length:1362 start_codon:yes stop_codon:yes gene_type:complete
MKLTAYHKLLAFHAFLGFAVFVFKPLATLYFFAMTVFLGYKIIMVSKKNKAFYVLLACAYVVGIEVFLRMNNGTFFYEASKYLVILFVLIGMVSSSFNTRALIYVIYILLLVPGVFVALSSMGFETDIRRAIAFNLSGPICLGISAIFCYRRKLTFKQMKMVLTALMLPLVSMAVYLFFYTPNLQEVITGTESNFDTSGGFGPNQVATVLGLGMFVLTTRFFMSREALPFKVVDMVLLAFLSFRAIVTFSRGGVFTALIMMAFFLLLYYFKVNMKSKRRILTSVLVFLTMGFFIWMLSSIQTGGFIDRRYANEDAAGREKEDLTTGRTDLFAYEINEFLDHPFLGIGVGKVKEVRFNETGVAAASHNEMSRIVAEHGLMGIFAFLILLFAPLVLRLRDKTNLFFYSFYLFWLLTINHSSMRIAAPAFIYALCLLNITYEKKPTVHRQPAITKG